MGKLSARERAEFEEHFLDCPQCLEQLETEEDFQRAFKRVAAEDAARMRDPAPARLSGWLAGLGRWRQAALWVTAGLLLALAPAALYIGKLERARRGVDQRTAASPEWQRRYEVERQAGAELEKRLQEAEKKLHEQSGVSSGQSASAAFPAVASVFILDTARSADPANSEPVNRIEIPAARHWIVLSVERGNEPEFQSYRATVADSEGRVIWSNIGLRPTTPGALSLTLDSTIFHGGDYVLRLEGLTAGTRYARAGHYPFRVTIRR
jgi:hypothetical protein